MPTDAHPPALPARWYEPRVRRWLRLLVTCPGLLVVAGLVLALLPVSLAIAAITDAIRRRPWTAVRFQLALACTLVMHVVGLAGLFVFWILDRWPGRASIRRAGGATSGQQGACRLRRIYGFEGWWACTVWRLAARIYRMRLEVEGHEEAVPGPVLVFSRHASLIDTLLPIVILSVRHGLRIRFVMKHELLWDPCLDILGHRVPTAFVHRDTPDHAREIAAVEGLLIDMGACDAIVIYPEGTRFSPHKQQRVLRSLARRHPAYHERAARLRYVLPPHPGGPLGLLEHGRDLDVVFCAHTGLEGASHLRDLLRGALLGTTVRVRYWRVPAAEVPLDRAGQLDWLYAWWARIDAWIDVHRAAR